MKVTSVNRGRRERLSGRSFSGQTGIFKQPVKGPLHIGKLGLEADEIVNTKHHGGEDQAVYLYRAEDYAWWSESLGREVTAGSFGENLTLVGLPSATLPIGARIRFANVLLEITSPRIPCNTLETRMGEPGFIKSFIRAERPGLYCRVIREGSIEAGEAFGLDSDCGAQLTTLDLFRAAYRKLQPDELEEFLATPLDIRSRRDFEKQLAAAGN